MIHNIIHTLKFNAGQGIQQVEVDSILTFKEYELFIYIFFLLN